MSKIKKILVLIDCLDMTNGVSITNMELARNWKFYDSDAELIFFGSSSAPQDEQHFGTAVVKFIRGSIRLPLVGYKNHHISFPLKQFKELVKNEKFDIIHIMTPGPLAYWGIRYARKNRIPLVLSHHTTIDTFATYGPKFLNSFSKFVIRKFLHYIYAKGQVIICHTKAAMQEAASLTNTPVHLAPMGVDIPYSELCKLRTAKQEARKRMDKSWQLNPTLPLVITVGRIAKEKDVNEVVEATKNINANIVCVGDGPELAFVKKQNHIITTGFQFASDLTDLYLAADLFVSSSKTETCGKVFLEALAHGTPILVSSTGQHNSYLPQDNPAIIKHDSVADFHKCITDFLQNETLDFANYALKVVNQYSWKTICHDHFSPYFDY